MEKIISILFIVFSIQLLRCQIIDIDYNSDYVNKHLSATTTMSKIIIQRDSLGKDTITKSIPEIVAKDFSYLKKIARPLDKDEDRTEFLRSSSLETFSNGTTQASARIFKLCIGEYGRFFIPLYIYVSASGNISKENKKNQKTIISLLNPIGGILNVSFNKFHNLTPSYLPYTKLRFAYQFGGRLINVSDSIESKKSNFFNAFGNAGLFFQTGAWDGTGNKDDVKPDIGIFYLQAKLNASLSSGGDLMKVFGPNIESNFFWGYSIDAGLEINKIINVKLGVSQFLNKTAFSILKEPSVKFSIDYSFLDKTAKNKIKL